MKHSVYLLFVSLSLSAMERFAEERIPLLRNVHDISVHKEVAHEYHAIQTERYNNYLGKLPDELLCKLATYAPVDSNDAALVPLSIASVIKSHTADTLVRWYALTRKGKNPRSFFQHIQGSEEKKKALEDASNCYEAFWKDLHRAVIHKQTASLKNELSIHIAPADKLQELNATDELDNKHVFAQYMVSKVKKLIADRERYASYYQYVASAHCVQNILLVVACAGLLGWSMSNERYLPAFNCFDSYFNMTDCTQTPTAYNCSANNPPLEIAECCFDRADSICDQKKKAFDNQWDKEHPEFIAWLPFIVGVPVLAIVRCIGPRIATVWCIEPRIIPDEMKQVVAEYNAKFSGSASEQSPDAV